MVTRIVRSCIINPYFLSFISIYVMIRCLRAHHVNLPAWVNGQVNDLICIPVILLVTLCFLRIIKRNERIEINVFLIGLVCLEFSVVFEWYLPQKSTIYTGDSMDVIMYFLGGIIFYFVQRKITQKSLSRKYKSGWYQTV